MNDEQRNMLKAALFKLQSARDLMKKIEETEDWSDIDDDNVLCRERSELDDIVDNIKDLLDK